MDDLTFAIVLTAAGATASAALITGLIAILKQLVVVGPWINADREPTSPSSSRRCSSRSRWCRSACSPRPPCSPPSWPGSGSRRSRWASTTPSRARRRAPGDLVRDGYLRGTLPRTPTARQVDVLAAFVACGGSVAEAAARCRRPAEHGEAPPRRPAGAVGPHDRAADLPRAGGGVAGGGGVGAWVTDPATVAKTEHLRDQVRWPAARRSARSGGRTGRPTGTRGRGSGCTRRARGSRSFAD